VLSFEHALDLVLAHDCELSFVDQNHNVQDDGVDGEHDQIGEFFGDVLSHFFSDFFLLLEV
jgi:hypothetical protein